MHITNNHNQLNTFRGGEYHGVINTQLRDAISKGELPSVELLYYSQMMFNLFNDPNPNFFQPSLGVKWQLYFAAHSKRINDQNILLGEGFNYHTYLSSKDLAGLFFILNSYQGYEKNQKNDLAIFPEIVSFFEKYMIELCKSDAVKAREVLDALISYNNPSLSGIITSMRDKMIEIANDNIKIANDNYEYNRQLPIFSLSTELLARIITYVNDPQLTEKISVRFRGATVAAAPDFLQKYRGTQNRIFQQLLASPKNDVERYQALKKIQEWSGKNLITFCLSIGFSISNQNLGVLQNQIASLEVFNQVEPNDQPASKHASILRTRMKNYPLLRDIKLLSISARGDQPFSKHNEQNPNIELPSEIRYFTGLQTFSAPNSSLEYLPAEIGELPLTQIDISGSHIASLPRSVSQLLELRTLKAANSRLASLPDEIIKELHELTEIDISGTPIDSLPESIKQLPNLTMLNVANSRIPEEEIAALRIAMPSVNIVG